MPRSKEQDRERKRLYREAHPEKVKASANKCYANRREKRLAEKREYYARNKERIKEYQREYRAKNAEALNKGRAEYRARNRESITSKALQIRSGFTSADKRRAIELQGNACAICSTDFTTLSSRHIHADHCHKSGAPRGVLCSSCNLGLGKFKDDPELLIKAARYLKEKVNA